jgi:predicted glycosyltransferase
MNIWIDLSNSPHVNFFSGIIRELEKDHEILLTCRPLANTIDLLDMNHFTYHIVGKHYGKNIVKKTFGFPLRILQLYCFLKNRRIDRAISHSSYYSPFVAKMMGISCIYINDNEHAAGNRISFKFADYIMIPEFLDIDKIRRQGARDDKIIKYPGLKEGVYLWNYSIKPTNGHKSKSIDERKNIFIRPEPSTAQYYKGRQNFIDDLLLKLKENFRIIILPRNEVQEAHYRQEKFAGIKIPDKSMNLTDVLENCNLFIGAGGTMTREAAVYGIPTISVYQDSLLDVDKFLIENGNMIHKKDLNASHIINYLTKIERKPPDNLLLQKGKKAHKLIKQTLLENT